MGTEATKDSQELKSGKAWAWLTVVGLGFVAAGGLQQILANSGNFIPMIVGELGCDPGQLTLWITMYAIFMAISQLYVGRLWPKVNTKVLVSIAYTISIVAMALFGTYTEVWQFWVSGAIIGLSGGVYFMVAAPILVTNWFAKGQGLALGVAGIIGGLLAAILSPVDAMIVATVGWRSAYFIVAIISLVIGLPWILFVFTYDPAKKGMRPVGWEPGMTDNTAGAEDAGGVPAGKAVGSLVFIALFIGVGAFALYGGFQNLWGYASAEWGFDTIFTSTMISATALFTLLGPIIGIVIDKIGPWKTGYGVMVIQLIAALGLIFFHTVQVVILIFVFLFAFQGAIVGQISPLLIRDCFGARDYTKILSYLQIGIGLIGGFSAPAVSFFYTTYGTFAAALWFGVGIAVVGLVCLTLAKANKQKVQEAKWIGPRDDV